MWLRLRQVALVAEDLDAVLADLHAIFGLEVAYRDPAVAAFGLQNAVLPVGNQFLEVVSPVRPGTAAGRQLERRGGDGGYMVIMHTDDHGPRRRRVADLGIRIALESEEAEYHIMQLHPGDTGGSFLEIDWQAGGEDLEGPWLPAGREWQQARRTEVVDAITGVDIEASEPDRVARRWAEILERDIRTDADGRLSLSVDGAAGSADIRFLPTAAHRGDGLAGIRVRAVDRERARSAADGRSRLQADGAIRICGTRFEL